MLPATIRVLLLAEEAERVDFIRSALGEHSNVEIVGEVSSFEEAMRLVEELPPDLIVFTGRDRRSWGAFVKWVANNRPDVEVFWADQLQPIASELIRVNVSLWLRRIGVPRPSERFFQGLDRPPKAPLSPEETEILQRVAYGDTFKEITDRLRIEPDTVHVHLERAFEKLGGNDRAHAVAIAIRQGLVE